MIKASLVIFIFISLQINAQIKWNDFNEVFQSQRIEKPILLYFTADWCQWCKQMELSTFNEEEVIDLFNNKFIPIKINESDKYQYLEFGNRSMLAKEFIESIGITTFPLIVITDSELNPLKKITGYFEKEELLLEIQNNF